MRPPSRPIGELFRPGVRVTDGYHPEMTVVSPHRIGTLRVPSGLPAVSGPDIDHEDGPHITVPVPPGEYVLEEAPARHTYHCEWEGSEVTRTDRLLRRCRSLGPPPRALRERTGPGRP
ncbi:hypothetical protein GCM10010493_32460 [Streptomyces lavendulae subsp. grasserius]